MNKDLEHKGVVLAVNHGWIDVAVQTESACETCKIKGACDLGGREEKIVSVPNDPSGAYREGEKVIVSVSRKMGFRALYLAYVIPFILLLASLLVLLSVAGLGEAAAGLTSLAILGLYYLALWLLRDRISREIVFKISKSQ